MKCTVIIRRSFEKYFLIRMSLCAKNGGKHHVILHGLYKMLCPVSVTEITERREEINQAGCWEPKAFVLALQLTFFLELSCHSH